MDENNDFDVLDKVYRALNPDDGIEYRVFLADDRDDLNRLAKYCLQRDGNVCTRLVLINPTASSRPELTPYTELLASAARQQCGCVHDTDVKPDGDHILNALSATRSAGGSVVVDRLIPGSIATNDELLQSLRVAQRLEFFTECHFQATFACLSLPVTEHQPLRTNGLRPVIWLLDDDLKRSPSEDKEDNEGTKALKAVVNNLRLAVECISVDCIQGGSSYSEVQHVLERTGFKDSEKVAAFIVDLDWGLAQVEGSSVYMGHRAADLLSDLFPEIPVYVYTGIHDLGALQGALQYGADWCFLKPVAHGPTATVQPDRPLDLPSLAVALNRSVLLRYAAYDSPPRPDIGAEGPTLLNSSEWTGTLAKLFPGITKFKIDKVVHGGYSGALLTAFVSVDRALPGVRSPSHMTCFLKASTWPAIRREHAAVRHIIETRLGSHVANLVGPPVLLEAKDGGMPLGALAYSTAGLPENLDDLQSFFAVLESDLQDGKDERALHVLQATLAAVLYPLHQGHSTKPTKVWKQWGTFLPPLVVGELVEDPQQALSESLIDASDDPYRALHETDSRILFCNDLTLTEWKWCAGDSLAATFPNKIVGIASSLGYRVEIHSKRPDLIKKHYGPLWARQGMQVSVCFRAESLRSDQQGYRRFKDSLVDDCLQQQLITRTWPDPFAFFSTDRSITVNLGAIHGDLNLENMLICSASDVGTLVDFEYASDEAPIAYDLATLEAQLCNRALFPELKRLSQALSVDAVRSLPSFDLLEAALNALDQTNAPEFFRLRLSAMLGFQLSEELTRTAAYVLELCETVRQYGLLDLRLSDEELHISLAVYFTVAGATFTEQVDRNMSLVSAAYHLSRLESPD